MGLSQSERWWLEEIRDAVLKEREECAKIADEIADAELKDQGYEGEHLFAHGAAWKVAQKIRARSNESSN